MKVKSLSRVQLFAALRTIACQAPLSMGFSRQEYWSGLLFPPPGDLPSPVTELWSPALKADSLPIEPWSSPVAQMVKNLPAMKIPWKWEWLPTPVFLPGDSYGQRRLVGYNPWSHTESETTEQSISILQMHIFVLIFVLHNSCP